MIEVHSVYLTCLKRLPYLDLNVYENILSIAQLFHKKNDAKVVSNKLVKLFSLERFIETKGKLLSGGEEEELK